MKKLPLITATFCLLTSGFNAQVTSPNTNTNFSLQYVGWSGTTAVNKPLDLKNGFNNQPINFFTNSSGTNGIANVTQRMTITPTGLVGVGDPFSASALLHLNSNNNAIAGEVFRTSAPSDAFWRMYTGTGNGSERFRLYTQTNNNVFFQTTTANAIYGVRTGNATSNNLRMFIAGQTSNNASSGRMALGNNLTEDFVSQDRLHLHHTIDSEVKIRFSNTNTGVTNLDGANIGIQTNGTFRFTQFENRNINFFTPSNITAGTQVKDLELHPMGKCLLGHLIWT